MSSSSRDFRRYAASYRAEARARLVEADALRLSPAYDNDEAERRRIVDSYLRMAEEYLRMAEESEVQA